MNSRSPVLLPILIMAFLGCADTDPPAGPRGGAGKTDLPPSIRRGVATYAANYEAINLHFMARCQNLLAELQQRPQVNVESGARGASARAVFASNVQRVVQVYTPYSSGSGFFVQDSRHIATNRHLVGRGRRACVLVHSAQADDPRSAIMRVADVVGADPARDLALLKLPEGLPSVTPVSIGRFESVSVGDTVFAIGHPVGFSWTLTGGLVAAVRRNFVLEELGLMADVIQTDAPINPGNSGGPLFDENGNVIGVNSVLIPSAQSIAFAIGVNELQKFLEAPAQPTVSKSKDLIAEIERSASGLGLEIVVTEVDSDGDGRPERYSIDVDGDGIAELTIHDANGDHVIDFVLIDEDGDGTPDVMLSDFDGDGEVDETSFDFDGDGTFGDELPF